MLDLKDLKSMVQYIGDNASDFKNTYGNITTASIGAIQRSLIKLEEEGGNSLFGEPGLDVKDWFKTDGSGRGYINVLNCEKLFCSLIYTLRSCCGCFQTCMRFYRKPEIWTSLK